MQNIISEMSKANLCLTKQKSHLNLLDDMHRKTEIDLHCKFNFHKK